MDVSRPAVKFAKPDSCGWGRMASVEVKAAASRGRRFDGGYGDERQPARCRVPCRLVHLPHCAPLDNLCRRCRTFRRTRPFSLSRRIASQAHHLQVLWGRVVARAQSRGRTDCPRARQGPPVDRGVDTVSECGRCARGHRARRGAIRLAAAPPRHRADRAALCLQPRFLRGVDELLFRGGLRVFFIAFWIASERLHPAIRVPAAMAMFTVFVLPPCHGSGLLFPLLLIYEVAQAKRRLT